MSGVVALVDFGGAPASRKVLERLASASAHRGPDGTSYRTNGAAGFAHQALHGTPDALREKQPLESRDGNLLLAADARIDNRHELASALVAEGALEERTPTDAELILAAYRHWGEACPEHLIGDFAFVVWDGNRKSLFAARDPLGVKRLHYARKGSLLCLASEAQQIVAHPAFPARLDEIAAADYLAGIEGAGKRTPLADVCQLPPAHRLKASSRELRLERYWRLEPSTRLSLRDDREVAERFRDLFIRAVGDRLRTTGEAVGVSLSGGLDSASVAAVAHHLLASASPSGRLLACTLVFERLGDCDERLYTEAMAANLGFELESLDAERYWPLSDAEVYPPELESPFVGWATTRPLLERLRERGARLVLTGHGGDNLLHGSAMVYLDALARGRFGVLREIEAHARAQEISRIRLTASLVRPLLPGWLERALLRLAGRSADAVELPRWIDPEFARRTGLIERVARRPLRARWGELARTEIASQLASLGRVRRVVYFYDRVASALGMEARHPYLDRRLVELVAALPPEQLYREGRRKELLRRAMGGVLPEIVRSRRSKTSFGSFVASGLREREADRIEHLLTEPLLGELGWVDGGLLRERYRRYRAGEPEKARELLFAVTLEGWLRAHSAQLDLGAHPRAA